MSIFGSMVLETISVILDKTIYLSAPVALCTLPLSIVSFFEWVWRRKRSWKTTCSLLSFSNEKMFIYPFQIWFSFDLYCLNYSQSSAIRKTKKFYNSCINTTAVNERSVTPLKDLIEKYGGWSVTGKGLNKSWSVQEKMGQVLRDLNVQSLLSVDVRPDILDSSRNILYVSRRTNVSHHGYFKGRF